MSNCMQIPTKAMYISQRTTEALVSNPKRLKGLTMFRMQSRLNELRKSATSRELHPVEIDEIQQIQKYLNPNRV